MTDPTKAQEKLLKRAQKDPRLQELLKGLQPGGRINLNGQMTAKQKMQAQREQLRLKRSGAHIQRVHQAKQEVHREKRREQLKQIDPIVKKTDAEKHDELRAKFTQTIDQSVADSKNKHRNQDNKLRKLQKKVGSITVDRCYEALTKLNDGSLTDPDAINREKNLVDLYFRQNPNASTAERQLEVASDEDEDSGNLESLDDGGGIPPMTPLLSIGEIPPMTPLLPIGDIPPMTPLLSIGEIPDIAPLLSIGEIPDIAPLLPIEEIPDIAPLLSIGEIPDIAPLLSIGEIPDIASLLSMDEPPVEVIEEPPVEVIEEPPVEVIEEPPIDVIYNPQIKATPQTMIGVFDEVPSEQPIEVVSEVPVEVVSEASVEELASVTPTSVLEGGLLSRGLGYLRDRYYGAS